MKNRISKILLAVLMLTVLALIVGACGDKGCSHENQITLESKAPTCTAAGLSEGKQCADCQAIIVAQTEFAAAGHIAQTLDAKAPTCTEAGLTEGKECSVCKAVLTAQAEIPATGHTDEELPAVAPTCTETGLTAGTKCSTCGETTKAQETVPATGHTDEEIPAVAPTCTQDGLTAGTKCSVCGETTKAQEVDPATGHTPAAAVEENKVEATCTDDGSYESVVYCLVCGAEISREDKTISALGHTPEAAVEENRTEPDCVNEGSYESVVYCSVCDAEISREEKTIPANGHTPKAAVEENRTEPDCVNAGSYDSVVYCSVCDAEVSRDTTPIPANGHTEETIPAVAKTCTTAGSTEGVKCSVCDDVLVAPEVIPASHEAEVVEGYAPTCEGAGLADGSKCSVCQETLLAQEPIPATGHTEETIPAVAPTCTETGLTAGVKCSVCGEILTEQEPVDALGHDMQLDESYLDENGNPTCLSNGDYIYTCTNGCGKQDKNLNGETNNGSRHAGYTQGDYKTAPTCISAATYYCSDCGTTFDAYEDDVNAQPTGNHNYSNLVSSNDATCAQYGYTVHSCTDDPDCTAEQTTVTADKLEHTLVVVDEESDTIACSVCGATFRNITADVQKEETKLCKDEACDGTDCLVHDMVVITTAKQTPAPDTELPEGSATETTPEKAVSIISLAGAEDTTYEIKLYNADGEQITTFTAVVNNGEAVYDVPASETGTAYIDISEVADQVASIEITASAAATVSFYNVVE